MEAGGVVWLEVGAIPGVMADAELGRMKNEFSKHLEFDQESKGRMVVARV